MGQAGAMIADAASMGPRYAHRLLTGITKERFARMPSAGNQCVEANHPAFTLGHLCLYPVKVLELLGHDTSSAQPPAKFDVLFSKDATCVDDPDGTHYPSSETIVAFFHKSYASAVEALRTCTDEQLAAENPVDTPMKQFCPTLGSLLNFYMTSHVMTHLGQLSTWRRIEGLPPA